MGCMAIDRSVSKGFGSVASLYDSIRPSYPTEAVSQLRATVLARKTLAADLGSTGATEAGSTVAGVPHLRVADVGAGTGKLTELFVRAGDDVTAVEPDERMLAALAEHLPTVQALVGSGEATGLEDDSVDLLVVAQAFHWMNPDVAFAEFARVVRPGGSVALIWNVRDDRVPWVQRFNRLLDQFGDGAMANHPARPEADSWSGFSTFVETNFSYEQELDEERLVALAGSRSYVIALPEDERLKFLDQVAHFARTDADLAGPETFSQPYVTRVFRFDRLLSDCADH